MVKHRSPDCAGRRGLGRQLPAAAVQGWLSCLVGGAVLLFVGLAQGCFASGQLGGFDDNDGFAEEVDEAGTEDPADLLQLVRGLRIASVTISQAVAIDVLRDGVELLEPTAPLIAEREALVRVFVEPGAGWTPRSVKGELLWRSGVDEWTLSEERLVSVSSQAQGPETTFDFQLPAAALTVDASFSLSLWEQREVVENQEPADSDGARWPEQGEHLLEVRAEGGALRVVLLPIRYEDDGSRRVPNIDAEMLQAIADRLYQLYPLRELELTVADPASSDVELRPDGTGWSELLSDLRSVRSERDIPFDSYVHALVNPADSMAEYCPTGCVAGLGYRVEDPGAADSKVSVGTGFEATRSARSLVHELAHLHDRGHASCGQVPNPDLNFPYAGGLIGVEGFDVLTGTRLDPNQYADFLSYCPDLWVSDYTFTALHERIAAVEALRLGREARPRQSYLSFAVAGDGSLSFEGHGYFSWERPDPDWRVQFLDRTGQAVATADASFLRFSDLPGGTLLVPTPELEVVALRIGRRSYSLAPW